MLDEWIPLALSSDRSSVLANFNSQSSSVLLYNLFADKLLRLGLAPDEVHDSNLGITRWHEYANSGFVVLGLSGASRLRGRLRFVDVLYMCGRCFID